MVFNHFGCRIRILRPRRERKNSKGQKKKDNNERPEWDGGGFGSTLLGTRCLPTDQVDMIAACTSVPMVGAGRLVAFCGVGLR